MQEVRKLLHRGSPRPPLDPLKRGPGRGGVGGVHGASVALCCGADCLPVRGLRSLPRETAPTMVEASIASSAHPARVLGAFNFPHCHRGRQDSHQDPVGSPHQSQGSVPGVHWGIIQSVYAARRQRSLILAWGTHMPRRANGLLAALVSSSACHAGSMAPGGEGAARAVKPLRLILRSCREFGGKDMRWHVAPLGRRPTASSQSRQWAAM